MERDTEQQSPTVGDLACLDPQLPLLVVDIQEAGYLLRLNEKGQAFYCDNDHGITWFDQLPAHTQMAKIMLSGALFWLPLIWLSRYPEDIK